MKVDIARSMFRGEKPDLCGVTTRSQGPRGSLGLVLDKTLLTYAMIARILSASLRVAG